MTQATLPRTIPPPRPDDTEDVVSALETADVFWNRGDSEEALRWLRRAIETAGDVGNDTRAAALARAAADLKSSSQTARASDAPGASAAPAPSTRPLAPASAMVARQEPPVLEEELEPDPRTTLVGFTLPASNGAAPSHAPPPRLEVDSVPEDSERAESTLVAPKAESPDPHVDASPPAEAVPATRPADAMEPVCATSRSVLQGGRPFARSAIHVYVLPDSQDGERLDVRVLRAGEAAPPGAQMALLVPLERHVDLVASSRSRNSTNGR